jgi:hypothetical protein
MHTSRLVPQGLPAASQYCIGFYTSQIEQCMYSLECYVYGCNDASGCQDTVNRTKTKLFCLDIRTYEVYDGRVFRPARWLKGPLVQKGTVT